MDNPTRWNITNSAQNIVSALVDPSKQFDSVFRREWSNTFAGFPKSRPTLGSSKFDAELKTSLTYYVNKLEDRKHEIEFEAQQNGTPDRDFSSSSRVDVPEVFMIEDFDLSNPDIFTKVLQAGECDLDNIECDHAKNYDAKLFDDNSELYDPFYLFTKRQLAELQQNFTDYLDITEERLASQISNRSGDFFQVMSSVDCVMDELSLAIKSVTSLRKKCSKLNDALIMPNMRSIEMNKTRNNAQSFLDKMNEIAYLCKVQPTIQILLSASDFVGALELIARSRSMLHKDLNRVISLRHLESQLVEIERMIGTMMQQEFLTLISSEWDGSFNQQSSASRLSKLFDYFANSYSELPARGNLTLLSLLQIQAEKFVNQFHEERKKRVESVLDMEQWKVIKVPQDFQRLISLLIDEDVEIGEIFSIENFQQPPAQNGISESSSSLATLSGVPTNGDTGMNAYLSRLKINRSSSKDSLASETGSTHSQPTTIKSDTSNHLLVAGSTYVTVNSVINLVRTVMDYCKCAHDIRSLSADLLERLFKILQLYNSKTYHLVYSNGAIQVGGLKTITTRSLIVSQRSLRLIILMLPAVHRHFAQLLPGDKRLKRFDEIRAAYEEHAAKIPQRVKLIVRDIIDLQLKEWEAKPPVPSAQFSAVTQHLTRLHDNIQDILPPDELTNLFAECSKAFKEVLMVHLRRLRITNDAGPQQWLVTQELTFYKISLSKLRAFNKLELSFDDTWAGLSEPDQDKIDLPNEKDKKENHQTQNKLK